MENLHLQNNALSYPLWIRICLTIALLFLSIVMSISCSKSDNKMIISEVTVEQLYELSNADSTLFLLDVRTAPEFTDKRVTFASALIPYDQLEENQALLPTDSTTPIYCFCRTGRRSGIATSTLSSMGYTTVYNVTGGIVRWEEVGYPITHGPFQR